jgi:hypothetical protein
MNQSRAGLTLAFLISTLAISSALDDECGLIDG